MWTQDMSASPTLDRLRGPSECCNSRKGHLIILVVVVEEKKGDWPEKFRYCSQSPDAYLGIALLVGGPYILADDCHC